jgi:quercetin dioxygenase-like cupin family protein
MPRAMSSFVALPLTPGLVHHTAPYTLRALGPDAAPHALGADGTTTLFVTAGRVALRGARFEATLTAPAWAVLAEPTALVARTDDARALALDDPTHRGLTQLGPTLEARGRLRYVDGCTDSLLVCPPRLGEPCLNHLHIPAGTRQSAHHHPSIRVGVIARGHGRCVSAVGEHALSPGLGWLIPAGLVHAFHTDDAPLDVLAWHPDSDFGPRDEDHPMINRTILGGR